MHTKKRAVFLIGTYDDCGRRPGAFPLAESSMRLLEELEIRNNLEAHVVYAVTDRKFGGREKEVKLGDIKAERERVLQEVADIDPDFVFLFGRTALFCAHGRGSLTLDAFRWKPVPVECFGRAETYLVDGLSRVRAQHGIAKQMKLDVHAAVNGIHGTTWGDYTLLMPGSSTEVDMDTIWKRYPNMTIYEDYATWHTCPKDLRDLPSGTVVGFDLETYPAFSPHDDGARIRMAMITAEVGKAYVVQCTQDSGIPDWLADILSREDIIKAGSFIAFDYNWCRAFGYHVANLYDTSVVEHIMDENNPETGLKFLTFKYLPRLGNYAKEQNELAKARGGWQYVDDWEQYEYAAADAEASLAAALGQMKLVSELGLEQPVKLANDLYQELAYMMAIGARVDEYVLRDLDRKFNDKLSQLRRGISELVGPINPASYQEVADMLKVEVSGIDLRVPTFKQWWEDDEIEKESTARDILERERDKHPVIPMLLEFRTWAKLHGTYISATLNKHLQGGFIYPKYNQNRTDTHRLSSSNPNKQNIPRKPEENEFYDPALNVKQMFVSRFDGGSIMEADYSQVEMRIAAEESGDKAMLAAIESGEDLHKATAALVHGKSVEEVTHEERQAAKAVNFGVIFGMGAKSLGKQLGISKKAASDLINQYFTTFPQLKRSIDSSHNRMRTKLEVESMFGFKRRFEAPDPKPTPGRCPVCGGDGCAKCGHCGDDRWNQWAGWRMERQAYNFLIQNSAACVTFVSIITLGKKLREGEFRSKMYGTVHDSILFDVYPGEELRLATLVKETMENPPLEAYGVQLDVPLVVDVETGKSWGDKKPFDFSA